MICREQQWTMECSRKKTYIIKITDLGFYSSFFIYLPGRPQTKQAYFNVSASSCIESSICLPLVVWRSNDSLWCTERSSIMPTLYLCSANHYHHHHHHHHYHHHNLRLTFARHLKISNKTVIPLNLLEGSYPLQKIRSPLSSITSSLFPKWHDAGLHNKLNHHTPEGVWR